jgi:hypothetical protein
MSSVTNIRVMASHMGHREAKRLCNQVKVSRGCISIQLLIEQLKQLKGVPYEPPQLDVPHPLV